MILQLILSILLVLITALTLYLKWSFRYWENRKVFTLPPSFPFGNVAENIKGRKTLGFIITEVYRAAKEKGYSYAGCYFISKPLFIPVDLNLLRKILIADFQHFTDHSPFDEITNDPLSANLFNLNGAKWKALRTKLSPLFSSGKLKNMFQTLVDCTHNFNLVIDEAIEKNEALDIKDTFARYTTDVIGSVAFGIDCNCLKNPNTEFRTYGKKIFNHGIREIFVQSLLLISPTLVNVFKLKLTKSDVEEFFMKIVKETIEYREKNGMEKRDFMQLLINLGHEVLKVSSSVEGNETNNDLTFYQNGLTTEEIAAQAFVFFGAGFETSSTTLNFLMFELVENQEIQEKLRNEILSVLKAHGGNITYEAVQEMHYLDKCIYETLRKYPPLPVSPRVCTKDYKVPESDLLIKKGTGCMIPIFSVQHDPEYYPNPEVFDPERFSEENKAARPQTTFLAFGEGPRLCIGLRMGVLQTKVGLIALLKDYKFSLSPKTETPLRYIGRHFLLTVEGDIWVHASKL